jgi:LmbE family N-acetylglucosaminyl deacetylase
MREPQKHSQCPSALAIFAHPDDESLASGGTLARIADLGWNVILLCASRGERGYAVEPLFDGDLGRLRTRELAAATRVLGIKNVHLLSYPDGNRRWTAAFQLRDDILRVIRLHRPEVVITFDDDGLYWHADHMAIREQTLSAMSALGADASALCFVTTAPGAMRAIVQRASEKCWVPPSAGVWSIDSSAFGAGSKATTFTIDVRPWLVRKLAALCRQRSQFGAVNPFSLLGASEASDWLGFEYFRRTPVTDPFDGQLECLADLGSSLSLDGRSVGTV